MFIKGLEEIFTPENLLKNSKNKNINFKKLSSDIIEGKYIPKPFKRVEIPKNNGEFRPIAIENEIDKIVSKTLYLALNEFFNPLFSDKSYGYRPNKGTIKAIKRVKDFIKRKYIHIFKSDINDFFETISHERLLNLLDIYIEDKRIIRLISLFLKSGIIKNDYFDHHLGIHQGDVLSPLLSNIYLNQFDSFLERENIEFVRFADDFILMFKDPNEAREKTKKAKEFIKTIGLDFDEEKSYFSNIHKGFEFLGCFFKEDTIRIENERFKRHLEDFESFKNLEFKKFLLKIKEKYEGMMRYYANVINYKPQLDKLKFVIEDLIKEKLKNEYKIKFKKDVLLELREFEIKDFDLEKIALIAYEEFKANKSLVDTEKIQKQKRRAVKNLIKSSVIVVEEYGTFLGVSKNKITLKKRGKITKSFPSSFIKRIIIHSKGVSLSSNFIHYCTKKGINIEFVDFAYNPYALLVSHNLAYPKTALKQLQILNSDKRIEFAKEFVRAKVTNQKNYLKYLHKYHKNLENEITLLEKYLREIKNINSIEKLLGYEGISANAYWQGIAKVLKEDDFKRITKGAKDTINSAFNYGYALLYHKVQSALIKAGLGINISFLHSLNKKPVLVFDIVEEFRTFIVDRAIVFALNKSDDIKVDVDGRLTKEAKKRIIEEVNERMASLHIYKKEKRKMEDIIELQAYALANAINEDTKYKSFIARF